MDEHLAAGAEGADVGFRQRHGGFGTAGDHDQILLFGKPGHQVEGTGGAVQKHHHAILDQLRGPGTHAAFDGAFFLVAEEKGDLPVCCALIEDCLIIDQDDSPTDILVDIGKGAENMISLEYKEKKYCPEKHAKRLEVILANWDKILQIIDEELPAAEEFEKLLKSLNLPTSLADIGIENEKLPMTLKCTKDIRDKYVLTRLLWDLGVIDEVCEKVS